MLNVKQESCDYQLLKSFSLTWPGNQPRSAEYDSDALTTRHMPVNVNLTREYFFVFVYYNEKDGYYFLKSSNAQLCKLF